MASGDSLFSFDSSALQPPATNPAGVAYRTNGREVIAFPAGGSAIAIFKGTMPRNYGGGNFVLDFDWMMASATSGTGGLDVTFERNQDAGADEDVDNFATAQTVAAVTVPATAGVPKRSSVTVAAGAAGTASIAAGDRFRVRVRRITDTAAGDLHLDGFQGREA